MAVKSGFVSIVGKPNAGKSTLLNALLGQKLSIISNKPQTTRKRILGIISESEHQIIFYDTPGILNPEYLLQEKMLDYILYSAKDSDILLFMIDITEDDARIFEDETIKKLLNNDLKKILLINKIDISSGEKVQEFLDINRDNSLFNDVLAISASTGFNINSVMEKILDYLPEHPKYYPDDQLTDENERFYVSEIIREKIFEMYRDEIPYSTEVVIEDFKERENAKDYISASIIIERDSQKPIIIGNKGESIKRLGRISRAEIEKFLEREVYLELFVKVKEKWRSNPYQLKNFGYIPNND
ncbi:MAG: GTPase Era [Ignavibacteriaceae bacterium]|nr:MAG: GTPase Era [bacterium BRH_c32]MDX9924313.1 GTPase Era [Ignavibacteriaceae bacterium]